MTGPDKDTIFSRYDPSSIGWLHRRVDEGLEILNSDLVGILDANPRLVPDPVLREYVIRGLRSQLKAKRGRKRPLSRLVLEPYMVALYDDLLPKLQARAERKKAKGITKCRGDYSPAECAQKVIGNLFQMEQESMRNLISSHKNRQK